MKTLRVKKYSNRKLYIDDHGIVTSSKLLKELENGADLLVTCHETGKDVTKQTLLSILKCSNVTSKQLIELMRQ